MTESAVEVPASPTLFQLCAAYPQEQKYWDWFVQRFNPLLVRSVAVAWRRAGQGAWPSAEVAEDLLQEIYARVLKDGARLLRNFQGSTEAEAQAYLARVALNHTRSHLRAQATQKRAAAEISLQALLAEAGDVALPASLESASQTLTEREFVELAKRLFAGEHCERNLLILLLYAREGYTPAEIARLQICELKESSIANLLAQMKSQLKKNLRG